MYRLIKTFTLAGIGLLIITSSCKKEIVPDTSTDVSISSSQSRATAILSKERLVTGLEELQGSTVGPDKALYVTAPLAGTIWRVNPATGEVTLFATGLPMRNPDPFFQGAGVVDVVFRGNTAYALVTGVGSDLGGSDIVGIYRIDGPGSNTVIADLGAWSIAHPPATDFFVPTGFQYSFESYRGGFIVTDGHHNRILYVTINGEISELITFGNVVPTGLAVKGNAINYTEAGPIPHYPEDAKLKTFSPGASTSTEIANAAGFNFGLFVDVEFGRGNTIFTLAQGIWDGPFEGAPALPNTGALLRLQQDGSFSLIADGLNQPTSMEIIGNTAYVVSLAGEIWEIENVAIPPYGQ